MDLFAELTTNNLEKPAMPFRMSRELKFWVEVECDQQDLRQADDKEVAAILREHERRGDAQHPTEWGCDPLRLRQSGVSRISPVPLPLFPALGPL